MVTATDDDRRDPLPDLLAEVPDALIVASQLLVVAPRPGDQLHDLAGVGLAPTGAEDLVRRIRSTRLATLLTSDPCTVDTFLPFDTDVSNVLLRHLYGHLVADTESGVETAQLIANLPGERRVEQSGVAKRSQRPHPRVK